MIKRQKTFCRTFFSAFCPVKCLRLNVHWVTQTVFSLIITIKRTKYIIKKGEDNISGMITTMDFPPKNVL